MICGLGKRSPHEATAEESRPILMKWAHHLVSQYDLAGQPRPSVAVPHGPALVDVRADADFKADPRFAPGAIRRNADSDEVGDRSRSGQSSTQHCEKGDPSARRLTLRG